MQWWGWIGVGVILLGAELAFVDAQFYLVFIGGAALLVGLLAVAGVQLAPWLQWLTFILVALAALALLRPRIYAKLRGGLPAFQDGLVGESVHVPAGLGAGAESRIEFRGSTWDAVNAGAAPIPAGSQARIERVEGLKLYLRAI
jgi:membrane protein implicated in regulation of membrane protease activity